MAVRQIIFRGKRKDNGEWITGYYAKESNHTCIPSNIKYKHFIYKDVCIDFGVGGLMETEIAPDTLGEYTGLTDKNGVKIFEGDIVKGGWNTIFVVFYDEAHLQFRARPQHGVERDIDYYQGHNGFEVIGNIHDNKLEEF